MQIVIWLIISLIWIIPFWVIFKRTGMAAGWSLLLIIPMLGLLICLLILAFRDWPIQKSNIIQ